MTISEMERPMTVPEQEARLDALSQIEARRALTDQEACEQRYLDKLRANRKSLERCLLPLKISKTREKLTRLEARAQELGL